MRSKAPASVDLDLVYLPLTHITGRLQPGYELPIALYSPSLILDLMYQGRITGT